MNTNNFKKIVDDIIINDIINAAKEFPELIDDEKDLKVSI